MLGRSLIAGIVLLSFFVCTSELRSVNPDTQQASTGSNSDMNVLSQRKARSDTFSFPSLMDIYPEIDYDLTKVTWAHGVDSKKKLRQALRGSVMMIEADVSLGKLKNDLSSGKQPVMAHPPIKTSDLSLEDFLDDVLDATQRKGIKLDIKSTSVIEEALLIVKAREYKIDVPLWLNADIVQGPVSSTTDPINPEMFLKLSKLYFPSATLSVGWTTRYGPSLSEQLTVIKEGYYTYDQVRQMRDALRAADIVQPVTFPIRAGLSTSTESRENILWLLNEVPKSTVTIWGSFGDEVDVAGLSELIDLIGKDRVYIDVHGGLRCQISRYRMFNKATSWLGLWSLGRTGRLSLTTGVLALLTYVTCASSFLPWNTNSYSVQ